MIRGSVQRRKWWETSALCSCGTAKFAGARERCHLETGLWPRRLGKAREDTGLCWGLLAGLCSGKEQGSLGHMPRGCTVPPAHTVPRHGGDAGERGSDHISAGALSCSASSRSPAGNPTGPFSPRLLPSGFVGPLAQPKCTRRAREREARRHGWLSQPSLSLLARQCLLRPLAFVLMAFLSLCPGPGVHSHCSHPSPWPTPCFQRQSGRGKRDIRFGPDQAEGREGQVSLYCWSCAVSQGCIHDLGQQRGLRDGIITARWDLPPLCFRSFSHWETEVGPASNRCLRTCLPRQRWQWPGQSRACAGTDCLPPRAAL